MKHINNINFSKIDLIPAFCIFSIIPAYYVWYSVLSNILLVVLSLFFVVNIAKKGIANSKILAGVLFTLTFLYYAIASSYNFYGFIAVICLLPIILAKKTYVVNVYNAFIRVYAGIMLISMISFSLVAYLGIDLPHYSIPPLNEGKAYDYYVYPFFVTGDTLLTIRFFGLFDEPGVVGTISGIILITENFNLKKWYNIVILVTGLLSLSLFFIILCAIYILATAPIKYKVFSILLVGIVVVLFSQSEILDQYIFSRLLFEDNKFVGDTRSHGDFDSFYAKFRQSSAYLTGLGAGTGAARNEGGSSYKQLIVDYGLIFFLVNIFCYYLFSRKTLTSFKMIFVFFLSLLGSMYQRPFVTIPIYVFLMIASVYVISDNYKNIKIKNE